MANPGLTRRRSWFLGSVLLPFGIASLPAQPSRAEDPPVAILKEDRLEVRGIWSNSIAGREWVQRQIEALDAELLANPSATAVLDHWCSRHGMAPPRSVVAHKIVNDAAVVPAEIRRLLDVGPNAAIRHRRVRLSCQGHILSEADNWYVPGRLSEAMNKLLEDSDTSFGRVAAPLQFRRRNLATRQIWSVSGSPPPVDDEKIVDLFEHRALLILPGGHPLALVHETYTSGILEFAPPANAASGHRSDFQVSAERGMK